MTIPSIIKKPKAVASITFIILFTLLFFFLGYNKLLSTGPVSIHAWRQSDSYAFALTYYNEGNKLLEPAVLYIGEDGHGKTVSEFPILYFLTAKIWKLTGVTPAVLKFINFFLLLIGLFHLFLLSRKILLDNFWAIFVSLFLFSSPILGYYGFNFIPNIPAFGLALTGLYYFFCYVTRGKTRDLILFTLLFILASLIKVTALISLLGAAFVALTYYISNLKVKKWEFVKFVLSGILIFFCYWRWYVFAGSYNQQNIEGIFNQSIIPVWVLDKAAIQQVIDKFYFNILPLYFNPFVLYALLLVLLLVLLVPRFGNPFAKRAAGIYFLGFIGFMMLFFQGLDVHDYFLTNTLIFIPTTVVAFLLALQKRFPTFIKSVKSKVTATLLLIFLINYGMIVTRSHYNPHGKLVTENIPLPSREIKSWNYNHYRMQVKEFPYQGMDKYLKEIGLDYNNKVISIGDRTPNLTLTLMGLRGFTEFYYIDNYSETLRIQRMIELGATHIAVNKHDKPGDEIKAFYGTKIGEYNGISIYNVKTN